MQITINREMVAHHALPLIETDKLAYQVYPGLARYQYRTGEAKAPCVIGAALPDEIASFLDSNFRAGSINCGQKVVIYSTEDAKWLRDAQIMHDRGQLTDLRNMLIKSIVWDNRNHLT